MDIYSHCIANSYNTQKKNYNKLEKKIISKTAKKWISLVTSLTLKWHWWTHTRRSTELPRSWKRKVKNQKQNAQPRIPENNAMTIRRHEIIKPNKTSNLEKTASVVIEVEKETASERERDKRAKREREREWLLWMKGKRMINYVVVEWRMVVAIKSKERNGECKGESH